MARKSFDANKKAGMDENYSMKFNTPKQLVEDLLKLIPFEKEDFVLDAGSGRNKVWFNCIPTTNKDECELEEGKDFYDYKNQVDWVVGNPPFPEFIGFLFKSAEICRKGFGFLTNHSRINQITPKRLDDLKAKGFHLSRIHIYGVKMWFGRYYFLLFTKKPNDCISFSRINYGYSIVPPSNSPTASSHSFGEHNMGLKVTTSSPPKLSPTEITSPNPNIKLNKVIHL